MKLELAIKSFTTEMDLTKNLKLHWDVQAALTLNQFDSEYETLDNYLVHILNTKDLLPLTIQDIWECKKLATDNSLWARKAAFLVAKHKNTPQDILISIVKRAGQEAEDLWACAQEELDNGMFDPEDDNDGDIEVAAIRALMNINSNTKQAKVA